MRLEEFRSQLLKRTASSDARVEFGAPADEAKLAALSAQVTTAVPTQVRMFYLAHDGIRFERPELSIYSLANFVFVSQERVRFASVDDGRAHLCFATADYNAANQWTILDEDSGYAVTQTMAHFWSRLVLKWLDRRVEFWRPSEFGRE